MTATPKQALFLSCLPLLAAGLMACGSTVTTAGFKGEEHEVAQTISNLQSDATAGDEHKICADDLASTVVARLGGATGAGATGLGATGAGATGLGATGAGATGLGATGAGATGLGATSAVSAKALSGCERAIKSQLGEVDTYEASVQSVHVSGSPAHRTATAVIKSVYGGHSRLRTVTLVKQGASWKISGLA